MRPGRVDGLVGSPFPTMFSEDALADERILSDGYTVGGMGEVMECGLAVVKGGLLRSTAVF